MEKTLYPLRGIVTTVISCFEGENKVLDLDSVANEIDMACKAGVSGFLVPCLASEQWLLSTEEKLSVSYTHLVSHRVSRFAASLRRAATQPTRSCGGCG